MPTGYVDRYGAESERIARRRAIARQLQQQAMEPIDLPQAPGVAVSPLSGLAKILQGVIGRVQEGRADKEQEKLNTGRSEQSQRELAELARVMSGVPQAPISGPQMPAPGTPAGDFTQQQGMSAPLGMADQVSLPARPANAQDYAGLTANSQIPENRALFEQLMRHQMARQQGKEDQESAPYTLAQGAQRRVGSQIIGENPPEFRPPVAAPSPFAKIDPKDYTPASIQQFMQSGNPSSLVAVPPKPPTPQQPTQLSANERAFYKAHGLDPENPTAAALQKYQDSKRAPTTVADANAARRDKLEGLKLFKDPLDSAERFNVMTHSYEDALKGDQQAMLNILANHLGMTMGLQKGARLNQALINEATQARPWLQGMRAKFSKDGYLSGVTLTPEQMRQMVDLGRERFSQDISKATSQARYYGIEDGGPKRAPNKATLKFYVGLSGGNPKKAKQLLAADGWTVE